MKRIVFLCVIAASLCVGLTVCRAQEMSGFEGAAVLYDQKFSPSIVTVPAMKKIRDFLTGFGAEAVHTGQMMEWMNKSIERGARGTLLVMNTDAIPEWVAGDKEKGDSLIRRYLEAGGTVVWFGDYPGNKISFQLEQHEKWGGGGSVSLIGIDASGDLGGRGPAEPTKDGFALGLKSGWESMFPVPAGRVTKVLAATKDGLAAAWTKQFTPDSPGFVRLWDKSVGDKSFDGEMASELFHIVSNLMPGAGGAKTMSRIYLHKPSDYYPLVHREGGRLVREITVSRFDESAPAGTQYSLVIRKGDKVFERIPIEKEAGASYFIKNLRVQIYRPDEELALVAGGGGKETTLATAALSESAFIASEEFAAEPSINSVDIGYALTPMDIVLATPAQNVKASFWMSFPGDSGAERKVTASIKIEGSTGGAREVAVKDFSVKSGQVADAEIGFNCADIAPGSYKLLFSIAENGKELYSGGRTLLISARKPAVRGFGAFYGAIDYLGQIGVFDYQTKKWTKMSWNKAWERGPDKDIVVSFPNGNRYIFWRGLNYVPFWVSKANTGLTYEWLEAGQNRGVLQDAVEPLQDKECRYSHADIVSNTAARAVVEWRYAEIGLNYVINKNEWGDEEYVFYPDGFGVRKATGRMEPMTWHEASEFIVILPPGINPYDVYPHEVFRIMSPDGKKAGAVLDSGVTGDAFGGEPVVFRVNYNFRDKNTPILAARKFEGFGSVYDGWKDDGRYISPNYWGVHFPIQRGYPTTRQQPPGWRERAGHASIATIGVEPLESKQINSKTDRKVWAWLIGNTDMPDAALLGAARSWLSPAEIEVSGATGGKYDPYQRGYALGAGGDSEIVVRFKGAEPVFNPVFIIDGYPRADVRITVNGKPPKEFQAGYEEDFNNSSLVVWIGETVPADAEIRILKK
ncbi:MAG: hypothetical protein WCX65_01135 [bacterium]